VILQYREEKNKSKNYEIILAS